MKHLPESDRFPFEIVPSDRFPGWEAMICRRWRPAPVVGWYRIGDTVDQERQRKDLRKLRAIWHQTIDKRQQTRAAVTALTQERTEQ